LTLPLVAPGTEFLPRVRQLDLSFAKSFTVKDRTRLQAQFDLFNVFNVNTTAAVRSTLYATTAYNLPASILQGRMIRLGAQLRW
jgi:hypothetical protein